MKKFLFLLVFTSLFLLSNCRVEAEIISEPLPEEPDPRQLRQELVADIRQTHPLSIERLRKLTFTKREPEIVTTLKKGSNYSRFIATYDSEGLVQRGLLTIPEGTPPENGWPSIIFNHGFIPPAVYRTTERYVAYQDAFARAGFITFKPDYRGHDKSEGIPKGAYGDPGFTIDVLNAASSVRAMDIADESNTGLWGHSMGGFLALGGLVIRPGWFNAAVIWGGVVASPEDRQRLWWDVRNRKREQGVPDSYRRRSRSTFNSLGDFEENRDLWSLISANSYISDINAPVQLHHADTDETVPVALSEVFYEELKTAGKTAELYIYEGDNHNISKNLRTALDRSVAFFKTRLQVPESS